MPPHSSVLKPRMPPHSCRHTVLEPSMPPHSSVLKPRMPPHSCRHTVLEPSMPPHSSVLKRRMPKTFSGPKPQSRTLNPWNFKLSPYRTIMTQSGILLLKFVLPKPFSEKGVWPFRAFEGGFSLHIFMLRHEDSISMPHSVVAIESGNAQLCSSWTCCACSYQSWKRLLPKLCNSWTCCVCRIRSWKCCSCHNFAAAGNAAFVAIEAGDAAPATTWQQLEMLRLQKPKLEMLLCHSFAAAGNAAFAETEAGNVAPATVLQQSKLEMLLLPQFHTR